MPKKYSLMKEEDGHFTLHDGKGEFAIAKGALDGRLVDRIRGLPKYAQGGMVETTDETPVEKTWQEQLNDFVNSTNAAANELSPTELVSSTNRAAADASKVAIEDAQAKEAEGSLFAGADPSASSTIAPVVEAERQPGAIADPVPAAAVPEQNPSGVNPMAQLQSGISLQEKGIRDMAAAQSALANEQEGIYGSLYSPEEEKAARDRMAALQEKAKQMETENDQLYKASIENKIDPGRLWSNMSTGNKVLAVIGLIFGGAASGGRAENNAALNMLNKAIDNDIRAQMQDQENRRSLYQNNLQRYRDATSAMEATRMQLNSITQGKIAQAAAKSNSSMAKAQADIMLGALKQQNAATMASLMQRQASQLAFAEADPVMRKIQMLPEAQQKLAIEELGKYRGFVAADKEVDRVFDNIGKIGATDRVNPFTADRVGQAKSSLAVIYKSALGEALQESDMKRLDAFIPGMMSNSAANREKAKMEFKKMLAAKAAEKTPLLSGMGIINDGSKVSFTPRK